MKAVATTTLGVSRSQLHERLQGRSRPRRRYAMAEDSELLRRWPRLIVKEGRQSVLAIADIADDVESFYNPVRRRSHLGGISPDQFKAAHKPKRRGVH